MKIFLDSNFNIVEIKDRLEDLIIKGSVDYDVLGVYIPTALKDSFFSYSSI